jgi:hypothetical protein
LPFCLLPWDEAVWRLALDVSPFILDFPISRSVRDKFIFLIDYRYRTFCYLSPKWTNTKLKHLK